MKLPTALILYGSPFSGATPRICSEAPFVTPAMVDESVARKIPLVSEIEPVALLGLRLTDSVPA